MITTISTNTRGGSNEKELGREPLIKQFATHLSTTRPEEENKSPSLDWKVAAGIRKVLLAVTRSQRATFRCPWLLETKLVRKPTLWLKIPFSEYIKKFEIVFLNVS